MAIYYARANGNVNGTIWATTPSGTASNLFSSFTNQDTLVANSFTVTLNVNTTVLEIRNDTTGGATNGGGFTLNTGITLNANCISGSIGLLTYNGGVGASSTIIGNITSNGGTAVNLPNGALGTLNIIGSLNGVSGIALNLNGGNNINITGNVTAFFGRGIYVINAPAGLNINITGNITGGISNGGLESFYGSPTTFGTWTVVGNVTGGVIAGMSCVALNGTVNIIGTATGGSVGAGLVMTGNGATANVTRAKGNGFGNGSVGLSSAVGVANNNQNTNVRVYEIEYGPLGQSPTSGPIELVGANSNVAVFATRLGNPKTLVDLNNATNLVPSSGNVRSGVSYNYGNNTGSCVIPHPNSVVYGVPVDNTIGSGLLSPVAVWNALTSAIGTSGTIGERLKNCSTISTVGKQLEGVL